MGQGVSVYQIHLPPLGSCQGHVELRLGLGPRA